MMSVILWKTIKTEQVNNYWYPKAFQWKCDAVRVCKWYGPCKQVFRSRWSPMLCAQKTF